MRLGLIADDFSDAPDVGGLLAGVFAGTNADT